jgi:hypothetical protein
MYSRQFIVSGNLLLSPRMRFSDENARLRSKMKNGRTVFQFDRCRRVYWILIY